MNRVQNIRVQNIQGLLRKIISSVIQPGDVVCDLTAGLGRDTLFLAQEVGEKGVVHAFDIQEIALQETKKLLSSHGLENRVILYQRNHGEVKEIVQEPIRIAMFNLGYLPGHDQEIITQGPSTLAALEGVLDLLLPGGVISMTLYRGHQGGDEEGLMVEEYLSSLNKRKYSVLRGEYINQSKGAPFWIIVQKNKGDSP
ncbi:MAG: methyltransferase domain-containing protein [Desulfitobacterium sp.]|nr:methyltransferase domain-containing protein [Desulfitobacterium sp.]